MDTMRDWLNKKSHLVANILFTLTLLILGGQLTTILFQVNNIPLFTALLHGVIFLFGVVALIMSFFFAAKKSFPFIRVVRWLFLGLCLINFVMQIKSLGSGLTIDNPSYQSGLFLTLILGFFAISYKIASLGNTRIHPSLLFVLTFAFLILFGALGLMLPASTTRDISFTHALFTSTSAVTVTGLAVLDTGKDFTFFGQSLIVLLIQLGGLGILTVTNLFALIFRPTSTFKNRMMISDMIKEAQSNRTFSTLFKIVAFTVLVEIVGAILIYVSLPDEQLLGHNAIFFSLFHAVSAFCNAGFSLLTNSLFEESVRFNYFLHTIVAWLIISGGIGYSVMINHWAILKNTTKNLYRRVVGQPTHIILVRTSINTRIIAYTTSILLLAGTLLFFIAEYHNTLAPYPFWGKVAVSFFNAVTPRTAGFNNINMADIGIPAIMLIMALMWVGASPGSTGGGIKTTTFAIALLNLWNVIKGKEKLIIRLKEIPGAVINQVNAVILLSIFAISFGTFCLAFIEKNLLFKDLLFESISAFSTVGLSVGITPGLQAESQYVLIGLMFLGRVSFLTFLIGLFNDAMLQKPECTMYYGKENVIIN